MSYRGRNVCRFCTKDHVAESRIAKDKKKYIRDFECSECHQETKRLLLPKLIAECGRRCMNCGRYLQPDEGVVHHRTYDFLGNELAIHVAYVCAKCHEGIHLEQKRKAQEERYGRRFNGWMRKLSDGKEDWFDKMDEEQVEMQRIAFHKALAREGDDLWYLQTSTFVIASRCSSFDNISD